MIRKFFFLALTLSSVTSKGLTQSSNPAELPKIIPPSPDVRAMQRYGETPIGYYTGTPNISIPLYEIKSDDITVPISISYNASGIKVSDEASRVGLGWVLNAGGLISRNIVGADDFVYTSFNFHNTSIPDLVSGSEWIKTAGFYVQGGCNFNVPGYSGTAKTYLDNGHDFQPDQYNYNVPGHSGKFILKRSKEAILASKEKVRITVLDNNANAWEITTADGSIYSFTEYETFTDNMSSSAGPPGTYKTAWYLTKITSPKGAEVNFVYTTVLNVYVKPIGSYTESRNDNSFLYNPLGCGAPGQQDPGLVVPPSFRQTPGKEYKNIYLNKIVFKDGEVRFTYVADRTDVINDVRLSKVQLYLNTYNPSSTTLFKEWELTHGYFTGTNDEDYPGGTVDQVSKRLKLISVKEKDASGNSLPPHSFTYNNETGLNPAKTSFARDHWGYYNGKLNNTTLIPSFSALNSYDIARYYLGIMNEIRDPDPTYSQLFLLKDITYPTGGKTSFEFEQNDFDIPKSKVFDQSYFANFPEPKPAEIRRQYPGNIYGDQPLAADLPAQLLDLSNLYVDQQGVTEQVRLEAFFFFNNPQPSCPPSTYANQVNFHFTTENGTTVENPVDPITSSFATCAGGSGNYTGITIIKTFTLTPGKYNWKLHINSGTNWLSFVTLKVNFTANAGAGEIVNGGQTLINAGLVGGVRLKRMLTYDNTTQTGPIIRRFIYNDKNVNGAYASTGIRMARPQYSYFQKAQLARDCAPIPGHYDAAVQRLMRESDSHIPINGAGGNPIGYSKVTELLGDNGEYGKTEYLYDNLPDITLNYSTYDIVQDYITYLPLRPPVNSTIGNPGNGNLLMKTDYRNVNGTFQKVAQTSNVYTNYRSSTPAWFGIEKRDVTGTEVPTCNDNYYYVVYPALVENRLLLSSTTSITYDLNDPSKAVFQTTKNTYDHTTHLQLKQTEVYINNGNKKVTSLTYPADYSDANAGTLVTEMKNSRFMHNAVITSNTTLNTSSSVLALTGSINKYQLQNSKVVNHEVAVLELAQPVVATTIPAYQPVSGSTYPTNYAAKILFEGYDNSNNLTQVRKKDDIPMSYIWDYNKSYPVAEISNAVQADVAYTGFEADGNGNWTVPSLIRNTALSITGSKSYSLTSGAITKSGLTNGKVYVISYWSRTSAATLTGVTGTVTKQGRNVNGWFYFESEVTASGTTITVSGSVIIDDLRCFPKGSLMNTFAYTPLIGITSQSDPTNKINYYEYDGFGRLQLIRDQDNNIVKTFEYKYKL